jgi:hypothetical protein
MWLVKNHVRLAGRFIILWHLVGCGQTLGGNQSGSGGAVGTGGVVGAGGVVGTPGGQSGSGASGGTGGSPGDAGLGSCADLQNAYEDTLDTVRACTVGSSTDCQQLVRSTLTCNPSGNCKTYVNDATRLEAIAAQWDQAGCANFAVGCPRVTCVVPTSGMCIATDGGPGFCSSGSIALDAAAAP